MAVLLSVLAAPGKARAITSVFFDASQTINLVSSGTTSDTILSEGYLFTVSQDKLFTGGVGMTNPIGRTIRIPWPIGLEAQAVTTGPTTGGAKMTIKRQDGQPFAIESFTFKLLANTAGAGAAIEVMPLLNGQDGVPAPFTYDATGYYNKSFTYDTPDLRGFDTYKISLYVDFAVMSLTLVDASLPPPSLALARLDGTTIQLTWPTSATGYTLESTTNLSAPGWSPVTNSVVTTGDQCTVQVNTAGSPRWFRLRK